MPERVAEVKQLPAALFEFVFLDDVALDFDAASNDLFQTGVASDKRFFQQRKKGFVCDSAVFQNLSAAVGEEMMRQGLQQRGVYEDPTRFCPSGRSTAVFPPTEESTQESNEVGT